MNTEELCVEFQRALDNAIRDVCERHAENHGENTTNFARRQTELVLQFTKAKALSQYLQRAGTSLEDALSKCEESLSSLRTPQNRHAERPWPNLPLEIIQDVVSLAYEDDRQEQTLEDEELDFRSYQLPTGATNLATHSHYSHKVLLSSTVICVNDLDLELFKKAGRRKLENVSQSKLRIAFHSASPGTEQMFRMINQLSHRITSLVVSTGQQLKGCAPAIPHLTDFSYKCNRSHSHHYDPDWAWLENAVRNCGRRNLRTARLPSFLFANFVSLGFLEGITKLRVDHYPLGYARRVLYCIDHMLDIIGKCEQLVFLELAGIAFFRCSNAAYNCRGRANLPRLRRLTLAGDSWRDLERLLWKFDTCNLKQLALFNTFQEPFKGDPSLLSCKLSTTFPDLQILRIAMTEVRQVLCRRSAGASSITEWNFPKLHTLDIRRAPPVSLRQLAEIVDVLRERSAPQTAQAITPINCFCADLNDPHDGDGHKDLDDDEFSESDFGSGLDDRLRAFLARCSTQPGNGDAPRGGKSHEEMMENAEWLLLRFEIERIVPNFICNSE